MSLTYVNRGGQVRINASPYEVCIPHQIGLYQLPKSPQEALIAKGGHGVVLRGEQIETGEPVVLKVHFDKIEADHPIGDEFKRINRVDHPNIVKARELILESLKSFMVIEYILGRNLAKILRINSMAHPLRKFPVSQATDLAYQIALGGQAVHAAGLIHRDLSPDNIMLTPENKIKLIDFGIARDFPLETKKTKESTRGHVEYNSPEEENMRNQDERTERKIIFSRSPGINPRHHPQSHRPRPQGSLSKFWGNYS